CGIGRPATGGPVGGGTCPRRTSPAPATWTCAAGRTPSGWRKRWPPWTWPTWRGPGDRGGQFGRLTWPAEPPPAKIFFGAPPRLAPPPARPPHETLTQGLHT